MLRLIWFSVAVLFTVMLAPSSASDVLAESVIMTAEGNLAMLQRGSIRNIVTLQQPENATAVEKPRTGKSKHGKHGKSHVAKQTGGSMPTQHVQKIEEGDKETEAAPLAEVSAHEDAKVIMPTQQDEKMEQNTDAKAAPLAELSAHEDAKVEQLAESKDDDPGSTNHTDEATKLAKAGNAASTENRTDGQFPDVGAPVAETAALEDGKHDQPDLRAKAQLATATKLDEAATASIHNKTQASPGAEAAPLVKTAARDAKVGQDEGITSNKVEAAKMNATSRPGLGNLAPLDDSGFKEILSLRDDNQTERFVHRVLQKEGLLVSDEAGLHKFAKQCIGKEGPRDFLSFSGQIMTALVENHGWVCVMLPGAHESNNAKFTSVTKPSLGPGILQPLNQQGYEAVSKLRSTAEMDVFIHRVVNHLGLEVKNRWGLLGIVSWFDGTEAKQSYAALTTEVLTTALKPNEWVTVKGRK